MQERQAETCRECKKQISKYVCPRCNIPYCSLDCYKTHSTSCTEAFYKENVEHELKLQNSSKDDKQKIQSILNKMNKEEDLSEEDDEELNDKLFDALQNVNLDDLTLDQLPPELQAKFKHDIIEGKIQVNGWIPWWKTHNLTENSKIQEITKVSNEENTNTTIPLILSPIPPLNTLTKATPSSLLRFNLINILYSYAFAFKLFNGDTTDSNVELLSIILDISTVLSTNNVFQSLQSAIEKSIEFSLKPSILNNKVFSISIIQDISILLSSRRGILMALSELHTLFQKASSQLEKKKDRQYDSQEKLLKPATKKIFFYICWINELPTDYFMSIKEQLNSYYDNIESEQQNNKNFIKPTSERKQEQQVKPTIIEEI